LGVTLTWIAFFAASPSDVNLQIAWQGLKCDAHFTACNRFTRVFLTEQRNVLSQSYYASEGLYFDTAVHAAIAGVEWTTTHRSKAGRAAGLGRRGVDLPRLAV
jgi:hypothetical protein